jgi:2,4'-dihydroxyacetophenone dioxygenase
VTSTTDSGQVAGRDTERIPFRGEQPYGMPPDLVELGVLDIDGSDERLWVPQAADVSFRPLLLSVSQGYFVNILRVRRSGILSRHKHAGPVHAVTLRGRWHYLEHDWWAEAGGYSYEPPGETHTLEVPDGVDEMTTLFHVTGAYVYVDPDGVAVGIEDVFTKIESARRHYAEVGLGADHVDRYIR